MAARLFVTRFLHNDSGATAIEYGMICALIFLVIIAGYQAIGNTNNATYEKIQDTIASVL